MKAVTLGEIMLRLMPPGFRRLLQAETFEAEYGGAEANVAVALAVWGEEAKFVSKVPANGLGQAAVNKLRRYGVDTRQILRGGDRLGIYYAERGADRRASNIVYDRMNSAFACSEAEEYD
ncbi:MAG: PfkB family carbohydrate kinase, partial [Christensenellaceae bacterium]